MLSTCKEIGISGHCTVDVIEFVMVIMQNILIVLSLLINVNCLEFVINPWQGLDKRALSM